MRIIAASLSALTVGGVVAWASHGAGFAYPLGFILMAAGILTLTAAALWPYTVSGEGEAQPQASRPLRHR
jgi:hypothetical protein